MFNNTSLLLEDWKDRFQRFLITLKHGDNGDIIYTDKIFKNDQTCNFPKTGSFMDICDTCRNDFDIFEGTLKPIETEILIRSGIHAGRFLARYRVGEAPQNLKLDMIATKRSATLYHYLERIRKNSSTKEKASSTTLGNFPFSGDGEENFSLSTESTCPIPVAKKCYSSNSTTINILIHMIIEHVLSQHMLHNYQTYYKYYSCQDVNLVVMHRQQNIPLSDFFHFPDSFDFDDSIREMCLYNIWLQISIILECLGSHNFSLGSPSVQKLSYYQRQENIYYKGHNLTLYPIIFFNDLRESQITYGETTIFTKNSLADLTVASYPSSSSLNLLFDSYREYDESPVEFQASEQISPETRIPSREFQITDENIVFLQNMTRIGSALFSPIFDFYLIIVSMMLDDKVYNLVQEHAKLRKAWTSLFLPDELGEVNQRILKEIMILNSNGEKSITNLFSISLHILKNITLSCDALQIFQDILLKF